MVCTKIFQCLGVNESKYQKQKSSTIKMICIILKKDFFLFSLFLSVGRLTYNGSLTVTVIYGIIAQYQFNQRGWDRTFSLDGQI